VLNCATTVSDPDRFEIFKLSFTWQPPPHIINTFALDITSASLLAINTLRILTQSSEFKTGAPSFS
jgi:hypothetical protein